MLNILLGLSGSVATIKIVDLFIAAKKKDINIIWTTTKEAKKFILSALINNILKAKINDIKILNLISSLKSLRIKSINEDILLNEYIKNWNLELSEFKNNYYINTIIQLLNNYESGIDITGVERVEKGNIKHINIANSIKAILIAPTSANTLSKITNGITDNFLLEVVRAMGDNKKVFLALAMNTNMLNDPFIQKNINEINNIGNKKYVIIKPIEKILQCGIKGLGAMENPENIVNIILKNN